MRTGVLGGTFDPPHRGHVALAEAAHTQLQLDRVLFIPAGQPYRKASRAVSAPAARLRMVEAAVAGLAWAEVSRLELDRPGPSYSDETLANLAAAGGEWWFIAGVDVLTDLPHWRDPRRLVQFARLAVAQRPPAGREVPAATTVAVPGIGERIDWIDLEPLAISSTDIRRRVQAGEDTRAWVPPAVRAIIDELGLYRPSGPH